MRAIIIMLAAAALVGCESVPQPVDADAIYDRAQMVRVCGDGWVGQDPETGRLVWGNGWTHALIAEGITADEVCDGKRGKK